jgi:hypothetical protein
VFAGFCKEGDFEVANKTMFLQRFYQLGSILRALPEFQFQRGAPNYFLAAAACNAQKALVYVNVPAVGKACNRDRFGVGIECLIKPLFGLLAVPDVPRDRRRSQDFPVCILDRRNRR